MTEKSKTKTLAQIQATITQKLQKIQKTITQINNTTGISIDAFNSGNDYQETYTTYNSEFTNKWNSIVQSHRQNQIGNDFEDIETKIDELFENVADLNREATSQNTVSSRLKSIFSVDKTEFEKSLTYHKTQTIINLILLVLTVIVSLCVVFSLFKFDGNLFTNEVKELLKTDNSYKTGLILVLMQFGGKVAIIFALGWLIKFLGDLTSKHSRQTIIYQDRLSGLNTAELIITAGRSTTREQILKQMAETYLNDKENAFKIELPQIDKEAQVNKKDIYNLLKTTIESKIK